MLLSDIFSIPFLICLAICILLIGCSSIYFYQRITQQDHKIASMVSLISSMAEDEKVHVESPIRVVPIATPQQTQQQTQNIVIDISQKIPVSDDSESGSDASSDTSDEDSVSDSEYSSTTTEDNEDKEQDDEQEDGEKVDLRIMSHIDLIIDDDAIDLDYEPLIDDFVDATLEDVMDILKDNNTDNTIKSIHLEEDGLTDFSIFKSISIMPDASSLSSDTVDFKKMSLSKLREIQGYGDLSKLKKIDILKLLGIE